jgi:hypothetical protein
MRFGFVPFIACVFPLYLRDRRIALNTHTGLILAYQRIAFPFVVRTLCSFFQKIPLKILEAMTALLRPIHRPRFCGTRMRGRRGAKGRPDERSRLGVLIPGSSPPSLPGIGHGMLECLQLSADARRQADLAPESRGQFIPYEHVLVGTNGGDDHHGQCRNCCIVRSLTMGAEQ